VPENLFQNFAMKILLKKMDTEWRHEYHVWLARMSAAKKLNGAAGIPHRSL
jgi:hypothetical protein